MYLTWRTLNSSYCYSLLTCSFAHHSLLWFCMRDGYFARRYRWFCSGLFCGCTTSGGPLFCDLVFERLFTKVEVVPDALMRVVDKCAVEVGDKHDAKCCLRFTGDAVDEDRVDNDAKDTITNGFIDRPCMILVV